MGVKMSRKMNRVIVYGDRMTNKYSRGQRLWASRLAEVSSQINARSGFGTGRVRYGRSYLFRYELLKLRRSVCVYNLRLLGVVVDE